MANVKKSYDIDDFIDRLISIGDKKNSDKAVMLTDSEMKYLCHTVRQIFLDQPMLLELEAPLKICGDIHGQFMDLLRLFDFGGFPPNSNYLFLGDYIDRGKQSLETICLLFSYKVKYRENFFLLRGNHESESITRHYGFYDECKRRSTVKIYRTFCDCFDCMPVVAIIDDRIFCCHGGISKELLEGPHTMDNIRRIERPTEIPESGLLCDLLWSDPDRDVDDFGPSDRQISCVFGARQVSEFLRVHNLDLICRGHQVVEDGYEFFSKRKVVTIFSAPNYCGEFDNCGSLMSVAEDLTCSFQILKPSEIIKPSHTKSVKTNPKDEKLLH